MGSFLKSIAGVVIGLALLLLALMLGPRLMRAIAAKDFEQSAWRVVAERDAMSDSVIAWLISESPSKEKVIERLGPPDRVREKADTWSGDFSYSLDQGPRVIDPYSLEIWFDNGRVKDARRKQH